MRAIRRSSRGGGAPLPAAVTTPVASSAPPAGPSAPVLTSTPVITGTTASTGVLTCSTPTFTGNPTPVLSRQWKRGATNVGTNKATYTKTVADEGFAITCVVTATNSQGSTSATSNAISVAAAAAPASAATLYRASDFSSPSVGGPASGVTFAPAMLQPAGGGADIVGFNFNAPSGNALAARTGTFAQYFPPGAVQPTVNLEAFWSGVAHPIQKDVLQTHADGSVEHAQLTTAFPALAAGATLQAMLRGGGIAPGAAVSMTGAGALNISASLEVVSRHGRWVESGGVVTDTGAVTAVGITYDVSPAELIASGVTMSYWQQGALVSQRRYEKELYQGLRVKLDLTMFADGTFEAEYEFCADGHFWGNTAGIGSWTVNAKINLNGALVYNQAPIRLYGGMVIGKKVFSALSAATNTLNNPPEHNIQFDLPYMIRAGAVVPYDLTSGVNNVTLAGYATQAAAATFRAPLSTSGFLSPGMFDTGDRADIGILPGAHADYFATGDARARQIVIAQGEAARGLGIFQYDLTLNRPLNAFADLGHDNLWFDARNTSLQSPPDPGRGRDWDGAHQPMIAYAAALITGRRMAVDALEMQALWTMMQIFSRTGTVGGVSKNWLMVQNNQPREAGWTLRDIAMAQFLLPDGTMFKQPMFDLLEWNFDYLNERTAGWATTQGECYGWLANANPFDKLVLKPWMQEHVIAGCYLSWRCGSLKARQYVVNFAANFVLGRGQQADNVFFYKKGSYYEFNAGDTHTMAGLTVKTWSQLSAAGKPGDLRADGWDHSGSYTALWVRSLALLRMMLKDAPSLAVMNNIINNGGVDTDLAKRRETAKDVIRPLTLL